MADGNRAKDRVDIGFSEQRAQEAKNIQGLFHLPTVQDVARIAIAYAARRQVELKASELKGDQLKNTLKGSELDQSGAISKTLSWYYPDSDDLEDRRNLSLEYLMNEGVRLLTEAIDEGTVTSLASLMPESEESA